MQAAYQTQQERTHEAIEKLKTGVMNIYTSDNYAQYLATMARFRRYSPRNTVMIWMQRPDATYVAGYQDWQKKFNRHVKKGERAIKIFAPIIKKSRDPDSDEEEVMVGCKLVSVFDIEQTEGEELPTIGVDQLAGDVACYDDLLNTLISISPVPVSIEHIDGAEHGSFFPSKGQIIISDELSQLQTIKTAIHEIAHAVAHYDVDSGDKEADRGTKEVMAESIAYVVCQWLNLDTSDYSFGYVASWAGNKDMSRLTASLQAIQKYSNQLINAIAANLPPESKSRSGEVIQAA